MNTNETETNAILNAEDLPDKVNVIGVSFRDSGKIYYFAANGTTARDGEGVIVETARGVEYGKVTMANKLIPKTELVLPLKKVLRAANDEDRAHLAENRQKEEEAFSLCQQKIAEHGLDMKLIEAEYTFDNAKLLFYFTSEQRVDFRELVKDLAGVFRTRIELRQIGIRDETKLMGGLGVCYREYCCHSFLSDFTQVSIKMAKEQGLSLNSAKISGACGRLMCCLRFEHETYQEEIKRTPKVGAQLVTPDGTGTVIESKPLVGLVKVRLDADPEGAPKIYDRDLVRLKTDEDETTKRGEKVERPKTPTFVPFTPLDSDIGTPSAEDGGEKGRSQRQGRDRRKGEKNGSGKGNKPGLGKNNRPGQQGKSGQNAEPGEKQRDSKGQNKPAQNKKGDRGQNGAEQASENRKKRESGKPDRYLQPAKSADSEPTLRADLTDSQEKPGGGEHRRHGRNHGRRHHTDRKSEERKSENSTKKSENN